MIARYSGICVHCGKPTKAGQDQYDVESKESYHQECRDNPQPTPEQYELADRLQYRYVSWQYLWGVHASIVDEPERDDCPARERDSVRPLQASDEE